MIPEKHRKKAAGLAAACAICVGGFEGLQTVAYQDASPAKVWTLCYGETKDVKPGDRKTKPECDAMLASRLEKDFIPGVERCVPGPMPQTRKVAYVSLAYNIGTEAFCRSSIARKHNAGDLAGACEAILLYDKAGGVTMRGLTKRRQEERALCLQP